MFLWSLELGAWSFIELAFEALFFPNISHAIPKPPRRNDLLLGVKLHAFFSLNVQIAVEGIVPAGEREHRHSGGHPHVFDDHPGLLPGVGFSRGIGGQSGKTSGRSVNGAVSGRDRMLE